MEKKVDLSKFRIFGSKVMAFIPKVKRSGKWDKVSEELLFMGFTRGVKGYRCINPKSGVTSVHRSVKFIEEEEIVDDSDDDDPEIPKFKKNLSEADHKADESINDPKDEAESELDESKYHTDDPDETLIEPPNQDEVVVTPSRVQTRSQTKNVFPPNDWRANLAIVCSEDFAFKCDSDESADDPSTFDAAMKSEDKEKWEIAMKDEMISLKENFNESWTTCCEI